MQTLSIHLSKKIIPLRFSWDFHLTRCSFCRFCPWSSSRQTLIYNPISNYTVWFLGSSLLFNLIFLVVQTRKCKVTLFAKLHFLTVMTVLLCPPPFVLQFSSVVVLISFCEGHFYQLLTLKIIRTQNIAVENIKCSNCATNGHRQ